MVMRALPVGIFIAALAVQASAADIDLAAWARTLPQHFSVNGSKVEPTYVAAVEISRDGDTLSVLGGAPAWTERSRETIIVDAHGGMRHLVCPKGMDCSGAAQPAGFLSTAALIAAARKDDLHGGAAPEAYGPYEVICVPAEMLGVDRPILDPCFEKTSGAAITQKNRFSHRFDGPILDPVTLRILPRSSSANLKDKAT